MIWATVAGVKPATKRKPKPKNFDLSFLVRASNEQHALFVAAAKEAGLTMSAWIRTRLIQVARRELQAVKRNSES
jgi:hypothetical protein